MKLSKKVLTILLIIIAVVLTALGFFAYFYHFKILNSTKLPKYVNLSNRKESIITEVSDGDISRYYGKKTVVLLWASWCPHCVDEMQNVFDVEKEYKDIQFLYVSHDKNKAELENYIKENNYNMFVLFDKDKQIRTRIDEKATGIPSFYLLDKRGNITGYNKGGFDKEELKSFIDTNGATGNKKYVKPESNK